MSSYFILVTIVAALDAAAIISAKLWQLQKNPVFLAITVGAFALAGYFFARSLQFEGIAITNIVWAALSTLFITIAGYFFFRESISALQFVGICAIVCGLVLVNIH